MRYSSRFFLYAPFAALCLLFAVTSFVWWREADAWSRKLDALNGHEIMPGIVMRFAAKAIGGFPFRIDVTFRNFTLTSAGPRAYSWTSEALALHRLTYGAPDYVFEAGGQQRLSWRREDGGAGEFAFLPGSIRASAVLRNGGLARFDYVLVALDSPTLQAAHAELHFRNAPAGNSDDLAISVEGLNRPGVRVPHGPITASLRAKISQASVLEAMLRGQKDWRLSLEEWRKSNGEIVGTIDQRSPAPTIGVKPETIGLNDKHQLEILPHTSKAKNGHIDTAPLY